MKMPIPITIAPEPVGEGIFFIKRSLISKNKPASTTTRSSSDEGGIESVTATHPTATAQTTRIVAPSRRLTSRILLIGLLGITNEGADFISADITENSVSHELKSICLQHTNFPLKFYKKLMGILSSKLVKQTVSL